MPSRETRSQLFFLGPSSSPLLRLLSDEEFKPSVGFLGVFERIDQDNFQFSGGTAACGGDTLLFSKLTWEFAGGNLPSSHGELCRHKIKACELCSVTPAPGSTILTVSFYLHCVCESKNTSSSHYLFRCRSRDQSAEVKPAPCNYRRVGTGSYSGEITAASELADIWIGPVSFDWHIGICRGELAFLTQ